MVSGKKLLTLATAAAVLLLGPVWGGQVKAQVLEEDFDTVSGSGGGSFLTGLGTEILFDWDTGIDGESAFGTTSGFARVDMSVEGTPTGGVAGSGAGEFSVSFDSFNMVDEDFDTVTGLGGGAFLVGDGVTPDTSGSASSWDNGIGGEGAFFVTRDGAVLGGEASAQGLTTGGVGGTGAGQLDAYDVTFNGGSWYGGLVWTTPGFPGGSGVLGNAGFDEGLWDSIPDWTYWADVSGAYPSVLEVTVDPHEGPNHLKVWGRAAGRDSSGVYQDLRAEEGQTWELDCWTEHITGDGITGTPNYAEMRIEFFDSLNEDPIASAGAVVLDGTSPRDVWIDNAPLQLTAPAGTVRVRALLQFVSPEGHLGAVFFDTVTFDVVAGPPAFDRADYGLTADVKGDADLGSGEAYGHYQLRIEDGAGARLVFESAVPADGSWQAIGGTLDAAIEKDASDVPADDVFDFDSDSLTVVLLFDPDRAPTWGTGGTLAVDNLSLTNERVEGSDWHGGLVWGDLPNGGVNDPRSMMLTADILGNHSGGQYELRLEGYVAIPNVDEDFSAITTDTETEIAGPGQSGGTVIDWSPELDNDEVFFATVDATVTETGGAWVRGLTTGGYSGSAMQIEVLDVYPQESGFWYAGAVWRDQALPSTTLSSVTLTAHVQGTWNAAWLQEPALYQLRIEDLDGDWIGFEQTYDGTYQTVGGLLSNADASGTVSDGNGVFDVATDIPYRVAIIFFGMGESSGFGNWGGTLTIDDVYLTPSPTPTLQEAGRITFAQTADGTFQSVGGLLSDGQSTWQPTGGQFYPEWAYTIDDWDVGLEGETAFAGYGWGSLIQTASAEGCSTCGVGGGGGGMFATTGVQSPPGWYWVGVAWPGLEIDMTDLSQVSFTIDGKGVWDPGEGETPGMITIRFEDQGGKRISWDSPAVDGTFHTLGGTLDTFTAESGFDQASPTYLATIIVFGARDPGWSTGATVFFDNVSVTDAGGTVLFEDFETVVGPTPGLLEGLDAYAVSVTMENGVGTWSTDNTLVVDNLRLTPVPRSCDADGDIDLAEFAEFQACFSGDGGGVATGCECSDSDGDGDIDLSDHALLNEFFTGPQ